MATPNNPEEFKKRKLKDVLKVMDASPRREIASEGASVLPLPTPRPKQPQSPNPEDAELQKLIENTPQALASGGLATRPLPPVPGVPGPAPQAPKSQKRLVRRALQD